MTDDLKKLAEAATPGPWEPRDGRNLRAPAACIDFAVVCPVEGKEVARVWTEDDARFIAAANPTAILALIRDRDEEVKRLRDRLEQLTPPTSAIELARAAAAGHTKKEPPLER